MSTNQPEQRPVEEKISFSEEASNDAKPLQPLPAAVQLLNVFPVQITAQRFPVEIKKMMRLSSKARAKHLMFLPSCMAASDASLSLSMTHLRGPASWFAIL